MSPSEWLCRQMRLRDWGVQEMADRSGLPPFTVASLMTGEQPIGAIETATALAKALGLPVSRVLDVQAEFEAAARVEG